MKSLRVLRVLIFTTVLVSSVWAASPQEDGKCSDAEKAHQFDFWIGEWEVTSGGKLAGHNSIQPVNSGCALLERWKGARGGEGSSFNFYNPRKQKWQQFWVWQNGTTLELEGGFGDGKMILSGTGRTPDGKTVTERVTWHDNEDGSVRQHWERSSDDGETWTTVFDGLYRKKDK
ncbi:MAG TPA: hypothetical protein VLU25_12975 [Acidobacteriota bacterium]|nr:hypothetical protein [Acidobacteriota bacterium]